MQCHRIDIPDGARVPGVTARGVATSVLPGEYLVHRLPPKGPAAGPVLRFVGADALGRDVHVSLEALRQLGGSEGVAVGLANDAERCPAS